MDKATISNQGYGKIEGRIPQEFLVKSHDAIPGRIKKLEAKCVAHNEFEVKPHGKRSYPFL